MDGKKTKLKKSLLAAMIVLFAALLAINVYSIITGVHIRDIFLPGRMTAGDQSGIDNDADGKGADSSGETAEAVLDVIKKCPDEVTDVIAALEKGIDPDTILKLKNYDIVPSKYAII